MLRIQWIIISLFVLMSCSSPAKTSQDEFSISDYKGELDTATIAGGCFWCVEASFEQIKGVVEAVSGYAGGSKSDADYRKVSSGRTSHAETVQVYYDPEIIDFKTILMIFFTAHDPTQLNRQGPDVGPQYRSAIFYHDENQKMIAEQVIKSLSAEFSEPIVTELNVYKTFYVAEAYHQDYEEKHPFNPYILNVSKPKIDRVKKKFSDILKEDFK